jgi:hypothetical protein
LLTLTFASGCEKKNPVKSGDEVFSTLEDEVLSVSLRGANQQVIASRKSSAAPFRYRFERAGARSECASTPELAAALKQTFSIRARRSLDADAFERLMALPKANVIELEVTGPGKAIAPFRLSLASSADRERAPHVEAFLREYESAFSVDASVLDLLALSCR